MYLSHLKERCCLKISGNDTIRFLQGLVTNDLSLLETQKAIYAGLLSPQGKILFDFIILKTGSDVMLDVACNLVPDVLKRLSFYKMRADISIEDISNKFCVIAAFGTGNEPQDNLAYVDPRLKDLGWRWFKKKDEAPLETVDSSHYHAHRIRLGVPEGGKDFAFGETYPHEALLDHLHGISFLKGCYVGQEVVSRMEHRGKMRKRIVSLIGENPLKEGADVRTEQMSIGKIGSVSGTHGLTLLRCDWIRKAQSKGFQLFSEDTPLRIELSSWAPFEYESVD